MYWYEGESISGKFFRNLLNIYLLHTSIACPGEADNSRLQAPFSKVLLTANNMLRAGVVATLV